MQFDIIASTGRTATTYLASALNDVQGVIACHEGYAGSIKDTDPLVPLINLENAAAYAQPKSAARIAEQKRSAQVLQQSLAGQTTEHLIDVAYYNAVLGTAILAEQPTARLFGIIRNCADFVRSATTLEGEDPLPVGWPDPRKPLTEREKFIGMGRIRPRRGSEAKADWDSWSAIRRNIWLWEETNLQLILAHQAFPNRVRLCRFETFKKDPSIFWGAMAGLFNLEIASKPPQARNEAAVNKKPSGYQIGLPSCWTEAERIALQASQTKIDKGVEYEC